MTKTIEQMQQEVSDKAGTDMGFRAELLKSPKATIESLFNLEMPPAMKVHAFELNPDDVMIALPRVDKADGELSDGDLEGVAGGAAKPGAIPGGGIGGNLPKPMPAGSLFLGSVKGPLGGGIIAPQQKIC